MSKLKPTHPGEILMAEFLKPFGVSQYRLAKEINVPAIRISQIVNGKRAISADTALRLSKYFGNSAEFWLNLQINHDLAIESDKLKEELKFEVGTYKAKVLV